MSLVLAVGLISVSMVRLKGWRGAWGIVSVCRGGFELFRRQRDFVERHGFQVQLIAVENERRVERPSGLELHGERRGDTGPGRMQPNVKLDAIDQKVARPVILKADKRCCIGAHRRSV